MSDAGFGDFGSDDIIEFFSDLLDLLMLSIAGNFLLIESLFSEGDGENSQNISISSFAINESLDQGLFFSDHLTEFISGHIKTIESGFRISTINIINDQLHFSPGEQFVFILKISLGSFDNSSFDLFSSDFCSCGFGDESFSEAWSFEWVGSSEIEPFLSAQWVSNFFLSSLFTLGESFIFSLSHIFR